MAKMAADATAAAKALKRQSTTCPDLPVGLVTAAITFARVTRGVAVAERLHHNTI
jgi:hypothetical protein